MAAYSAAVSLRMVISAILYSTDVALPPEFLKIFEFADKGLKSFQDFVERSGSRSRERMNDSLERVTNEMHKILVIVSGDEHVSHDQFVENLHSLIKILKKMEEEHRKYSSSSSSSSSKMVGLCDERSELKEALITTLIKPTFFLLHGMAGVGKTTLAWEVFEDLDILECFECRAWVRVSLDRNPGDFKEEILAQLNPDAHNMVMGGDKEETAKQLIEILMAKRCFIVLDDVWSYQSMFENYWWYRFPAAFENQSRVLVTTRFNHIDYTSKARYWHAFKMRLMNKEESWDLLRQKTFGRGLCPPQLEDAGKRIAERCDGLPLTIVTVADLLSKAEESLWIDVATQRKHQLFIDAYDQISKILYPSFKVLYDDLKLCFLYMGVFRLKYEIPRNKLINLWAAEEIFDSTLKPSEFIYHYHDLELLKYFDSCSLVMVYRRSGTYLSRPPTQAIGTCGLHSSWWHFCQREARKTNFFHVLDCPEDASEECIKGQSRLSMHNNVLFASKHVYNSIEESCSSTAESLLCFGPYHQYQVPICYGLKLLQRLDALNIRFYDFPLEVVELGKLRYLALTCNKMLPPSISKLGKLQYLTIHPHLSIKTRGTPSCMPMEIWNLEELKHLEVIGCDLPDLGDISLKKLLTLSDVTTRSCTIFHRLPNLKKLKIIIELTPDAVYPLWCSDHISNLESLKCIVVNPRCKFHVVPPLVSFPILTSSLKKLSLSGLGYPWEKMKEISLLPYLGQLKLRCNAFQGQIWEVEEFGFPSLYFLQIEDVDLVKLVAPPGSFKFLMHISIKHCYKLQEVQLRGYNRVFKIEVVESNPLAEMSIKKSLLEEKVFVGPDISVHYSWKSARETPIRRNAFRRS